VALKRHGLGHETHRRKQADRSAQVQHGSSSQH
jgi:hypothetical protein